jgi:hypothetical protein
MMGEDKTRKILSGLQGSTKGHLVGQLLILIQDARTHKHKKVSTL